MIERDVGDIVDRWAIAKLKKERIGSPDSIQEFEYFQEGIEEIKKEFSHIHWDKICAIMLKIHSFIWQFESGIKGAKEHIPNPAYILDEVNKEALSKIGLISIEVRNYNSLRIELKNLINLMTNTGFQEIKKDHLSE